MSMSHSALLLRLTRVLGAWRDQAPGDEFAGMSLEQFEGMLEEVEAAKTEIGIQTSELRAAVKKSRLMERMAYDRSVDVVLAMRSHPKHGGDSTLVRAAGFVTKSERRSGLTRKGAVVRNTTQDGKA